MSGLTLRIVAVPALSVVLSLLSHGAGDFQLKTNFSGGATLTPEDVNTVIELANRGGIREIEEIYTGYVHPSTNRFIRLKERDAIDGRKVRYHELFICKKGWTRKTPRLRKDVVAVADFWVEQTIQRELVILKVGSNEYRIDLRDNIAVAQAEQWLSSFLEGEFVLSADLPAHQRDWIKCVNFSRPIYLLNASGRNTMTMGFESKFDKLEFYFVKFVLEDKGIRILELGCIIE